MRKFFRILPFVLNTLSLPAAQGAPREASELMFLKPVEVVGGSARPKANRQLMVAYMRHCGESFRGILVKETPKVAHIGIVVSRTDTQCSSLPVRQELAVPVSSGKNILSVASRDSQRVILSEVLDVTFSPSGFTVSWQDTCQPSLGLILSPRVAGEKKIMGLHMASLPKEVSPARSQASSEGCSRDLRRMSITSVGLSSDEISLTGRPGRLEDLYALRLKAPSKLLIGSDGELRVTYERHCRELPVGVLFTGKSSLDLAMVTVFAPNVPCEGPLLREATFKVKGMLVAKGQNPRALTSEDVSHLAARTKFTYRLMPVTSVKVARQGEGDWMLARAPLTCSEPLGLLIGEDSLGNFAMAAVGGGGKSICQVGHLSSGATLTAPLVGPAEGPMAKVFGLRVFGTSLN